MTVPDTLRPTLRAALLLLIVFIAGTIGYGLLGGAGHSLLDAIFMTTITLTTVGYEETIDLRSRPGGQIFTIVLLLVGAGTFVYFFSNLTAFLVEGTLERVFWRRRMAREIDRLDGHYIVCGVGNTGEHVVRELAQTRRPFVVVDQQEERLRGLHARYGIDFPVVVGDATEDTVLAAAGLARARGLVACLSSDKDNILITFTARLASPHIRIVARCADPRVEAKLQRAGANAVVSPDRIGGLRLISEMVRPTAVSFLDRMLRDSEQNWRIEEVVVAAGSLLDGAAAGAVRDRAAYDLTVLAVRRTDGGWVYNPDDTLTLESGTAVIFMGSPEARASLERAAAARA
jgi:voltage-gated potassium channel